MRQSRRRSVSVASKIAPLLAGLAAGALAQAQSPELQFNVLYQCAGGQGFKVFSCTGRNDADLCEVQSYVNGQPAQRGASPRQQVMLLAGVCPAQSGTGPQPAAAAGSPPASADAQAGVGGFKPGDTARVATAGGWTEAKIVRARGNAYLVRVLGVEAWKTYPDELRRIGPLTDEDRSHGLYDLHEKVQVNFEGRWVDSEIIGEMGREYMVTLPGNRNGWTTAANLRRVVQSAPATPKAGVPPQPGLTSCAGKIEGRYATTGGGPGSIQIVFRSGQATLMEPLASEEFECWTGGDKIYLHKPGASADLDMPIDMNDDGTLQTPYGEIKKKGK